MPWIDDQVTEQFWTLEALGRGVLTFPEPVAPSPPFVPFAGYRLPQARDDGRRPGLLERWFKPAEPPPLPEAEDTEPEPNWRGEKEYTETLVLLPQSIKADAEAFERKRHAWCRGLDVECEAWDVMGSPRLWTRLCRC